MADESYDYGPEDIAHVDATFGVYAFPEAHVDVTYTVHLKNGETRDHQSGTLKGVPAAMASIAVLDAKLAVGKPEAQMAEYDRRWRNRGR